MKQSLKQSRSQSARLSVIAACAVLFMLARAEAAFAQQTASPKPVAAALVGTPADRAVPKPAAETEEPAKPAKPGSEGIKVHGHWKIVVKNPDGTVASASEFENSLVTPGNGDVVLGQLLAGQVTWGGMDIRITGTSMCANVCVIAPGSTLGWPIGRRLCQCHSILGVQCHWSPYLLSRADKYRHPPQQRCHPSHRGICHAPRKFY